MSGSEPSQEDFLEEELRKCRRAIKKKGLVTCLKLNIKVDVLNPSSVNDVQKIQYFPRFSKKVRENFKTEERSIDRGSFEVEGMTWVTNNGKKMDKVLEKHIQNKDLSKTKRETAQAITNKLKGTFQRLTMIDSDFPLYGYMTKKSEDYKTYLWRGRADAIAVMGGKYVIVEWKCVTNIEEYWRHFWAHLHQCLAYARLLQLHLKLDYLPYILIVPIERREIHPVLFKDYPEECKNKIESFVWGLQKPLQREIDLNHKVFKGDLEKERVNDDMSLSELFVEDAKLKDMIEAFGLPKLLKFKKPTGQREAAAAATGNGD